MLPLDFTNPKYLESLEYLHKYFSELKRQSNLNPDFDKIKEETKKRINYFDQVRMATERLDDILRKRDKTIYERLLQDTEQYSFTETFWAQIYSSLLIYNLLIQYMNIEILFLTMLKGTKNHKIEIEGTEPLGPLLTKIFALDVKHLLPEKKVRTILDHKLRNALAHGWYRVENYQFIYFEESLMSESKIMDFNEIMERIVNLKRFGQALFAIVFAGRW